MRHGAEVAGRRKPVDRGNLGQSGRLRARPDAEKGKGVPAAGGPRVPVGLVARNVDLSDQERLLVLITREAFFTIPFLPRNPGNYAGVGRDSDSKQAKTESGHDS